MSKWSVAELLGRRYKLSNAQSLNCYFLVFIMAENGLFRGIFSSDNWNMTKHGMRFSFSQNVLDMHTFSTFTNTV